MIRIALALGVLVLYADVPRARACGGFFCSQQSPVVQNAERIVFVDNGDGTITAIVEITYSGPSSEFAWVLPVPGVPEIEVAETAVLDALDIATTPVMRASARGDGCRAGVSCGGLFGAGDSGEWGGGYPTDPVRVRDEGLVGPYEYAVISVEDETADPVAVASAWLDENGYDVTAFGADTLATYLDQGLNLLAFRLAKRASTGSIRPVMLTFESDHPMIPILPTAVAAINDMGVLVFVLGTRRAVPVTYSEIEISDLAFSWNASVTDYTDTVSEAVDSAGGRAFVTELASPMASVTWRSSVAAAYEAEIRAWRGPSDLYAFSQLTSAFPTLSAADGFLDALREASTPVGGTFDEFVACSATSAVDCGFVTLHVNPSPFFEALERWVIAPTKRTQDAILRRPYLTRMFTTLDPAEMTIDPTFTFTSRASAVSNVHAATFVSHCRRRDETVTLEVAIHDGELVEVVPERLEGVPNPVRVIAYDLYGVPVVMRDRTAALRAAIDSARYRDDSGCAAREHRAGTLPLVSLSLLVGAVVALVARRTRQRTR